VSLPLLLKTATIGNGHKGLQSVKIVSLYPIKFPHVVFNTY